MFLRPEETVQCIRPPLQSNQSPVRMLPVSISSGVDRRMCEVDNSHLYNAVVKLNADVPVFSNPCYSLALNFCGEDLPFRVKMTSDMKLLFLNLYCAFVQNVEFW